MKLPDGFIPIDDAELRCHSSNVDLAVDEFSPFCDKSCVVVEPNNSLIVDRYYGQTYHTMDLKPAAIYGRTADFPVFSGESLENYGFLRVPFRRIPRRLVKSRKEIEEILSSIQSADSNLQILLRGQATEYLIERSVETSQWLFGEDRVLEPSISTSASRRGPALEEILPEWAALLKLFLQKDNRVVGAEYEKLVSSYSFPLFALALAQHYGLPTSGLDVTTNLDVALFFALMQYEKGPDSYHAIYSPLEKVTKPPVIYVLSVSKQQQFDFEGFAPPNFPKGRPDAQSAYFMHVGWGNAINTCARRTFLALYLDPAGDFSSTPDPTTLFPGNDVDRFAEFLEFAAHVGLPAQLKRAFDSGFYIVKPY